jgi:hypothetical protein
MRARNELRTANVTVPGFYRDFRWRKWYIPCQQFHDIASGDGRYYFFCEKGIAGNSRICCRFHTRYNTALDETISVAAVPAKLGSGFDVNRYVYL